MVWYLLEWKRKGTRMVALPTETAQGDKYYGATTKCKMLW